MKTKAALLLISFSFIFLIFNSCNKDDNKDLDDKLDSEKNEAPTDINLSNTSINENDTLNAVIGIFTTADTDTGDTHIYSLVNGDGDTDNGNFSISDDHLLANEIFDFETKSSYSIRVCSTDPADNTFEKAFTITITDLDECEDIAGSYFMQMDYSFNEGGISGNSVTTIDNATVTQNGFSIKVQNCPGTIDGDNNVAFSGSMIGSVTQKFEGTLNTTTKIISGSMTGKVEVLLWNGLFMQTYTVSISKGTFKLTPN